MHHETANVSIGSTLLAVAIPDGWLSLGGRWLFAVTTALTVQVLLLLFKRMMKGKNERQD